MYRPQKRIKPVNVRIAAGKMIFQATAILYAAEEIAALPYNTPPTTSLGEEGSTESETGIVDGTTNINFVDLQPIKARNRPAARAAIFDATEAASGEECIV